MAVLVAWLLSAILFSMLVMMWTAKSMLKYVVLMVISIMYALAMRQLLSAILLLGGSLLITFMMWVHAAATSKLEATMIIAYIATPVILVTALSGLNIMFGIIGGSSTENSEASSSSS